MTWTAQKKMRQCQRLAREIRQPTQVLPPRHQRSTSWSGGDVCSARMAGLSVVSFFDGAERSGLEIERIDQPTGEPK